MATVSPPETPNTRAVVSFIGSSASEWRPILQHDNQIVLYHPRSHALSIRPSADLASRRCPYCRQDLPEGFEPLVQEHHNIDVHEERFEPMDGGEDGTARAPNYFELLSIANAESSSSLGSAALSDAGSDVEEVPDTRAFPKETMAEGYFQTFFQEEEKLGMGANGSVYLCQHMLDGNPLGHFAVKKIAVGESHSYLIKILREASTASSCIQRRSSSAQIRLLEQLHHPNIITYHHSWLETAQFSPFGPRIPTLHVLMQWAEGGSLDDLIDLRQGKAVRHVHFHPVTSPSDPFAQPEAMTDSRDEPPEEIDVSRMSRAARIKAFRAFQRAPPEERERIQARMGMGDRRRREAAWKAIHLLSAEEVKSLFGDVVEGLGFLHAKSILHLDLKPGNVLLTWDVGRIIPRAMLSDFGTSRDMLNASSLSRSGNTGTLEYTSPESLPSPRTGILGSVDSKTDMWSLGMLLHKILFFRLPYRFSSDGSEGDADSKMGEGEKMDRLQAEVLGYPGFKKTPLHSTSFKSRRLPRAYLILLESLLNPTPGGRPSCEKVLSAVRMGQVRCMSLTWAHSARPTDRSTDALALP
ncbi:kinase-like domain-containing protein [Schizophyllum amplum]|uniref:Kinase-like domain-containing protein n=1 Tax=Schizophyllum amplum TaxID=97359 RepID=A0A550CU82_9AGAR|nr:kinase-like domain-containing protein [Auriculariopsis ampla]